MSLGINAKIVKSIKYTDIIANGTLKVQVKSVSLKKHGWNIEIKENALNEFEGLYIAFLEHEPEDIILYFDDDEMKRLMTKLGKKRRTREDTWRLYIPRCLKGFEECPDESRISAALEKAKAKEDANKQP